MVSGEQSQIPDIFVIGSQRVKITSTGLSNAKRYFEYIAKRKCLRKGPFCPG